MWVPPGVRGTCMCGCALVRLPRTSPSLYRSCRIRTDMPAQVAELGVPYVLMHMRGDPGTMSRPEHTSYGPGPVWRGVGAELMAGARAAEAAGVPAWSIILDPGAYCGASTRTRILCPCTRMHTPPGAFSCSLAQRQIHIDSGSILLHDDRKN